MRKEAIFHFFPSQCFNAHVKSDDFLPFNFVNPYHISTATHVAQLRDGSMTQALATFKRSGDQMTLGYLEVVEQCRGNALGQAFLEGVFDYAAVIARESGRAQLILGDAFTDAGNAVLLPAMRRLNFRHSNVSFECKG